MPSQARHLNRPFYTVCFPGRSQMKEHPVILGTRNPCSIKSTSDMKKREEKTRRGIRNIDLRPNAFRIRRSRTFATDPSVTHSDGT